MVKLLLDIDIPLMPCDFGLVEVPNPLTGKISGNIFGMIRVNGVSYYLDYSEESDIWWVNPRPEMEFYEALYTKCFYNSPIPEQFGYAGYETDQDRRKDKAVLNWRDIENSINITNKNKLLEIGCASGEFLIEAGNRGGWSDLYGVEIDEGMVETARKSGVNIFSGFFEEIDFSGKRFDLIFADNVIEHVMSPLDTLKKCNSMQIKGDLLILRLPDTQPSGPRLKLIDHTFHFTRKSISEILGLAGYKTENIIYSGTFYGTGYPDNPDDKILNMTVFARKQTDV